MIDGINLEIENFDFKIWETSPKLEFSVLTIIGSGIEKGSRKASYNGLDFIIEPKGKAKIKGSIHKFFNDGESNVNRLDYEDLKKAVKKLEEFGIKPDKALLRGFEIGLNLDTTATKIGVNTFLDSILYCRGVERSDMEINGKTGFGYAYKTTNAKYKFYNKAEQSTTQVQLLRIETKFTRMRAVENYGIKTLLDLLDREKLTKLILEKYLKPLDETIYFEWEQIRTTRKLPARYKSKFKDLRNPHWWIKDSTSRRDRLRNKKLLEKLVNKYAKRNIKKILKDLISFELKMFIRTKKDHEYTEFEPLKNWNLLSKDATKNCTDALRIVRCDSSDCKEGKEKKRYCEICGKEITEQRIDSKYCNDQRKCRDKAYNKKVSEKRSGKKTEHKKEILNLINNLGSEFSLIKTTNPNRKKGKGTTGRRTSIIVTIDGKRKYYHGAQARFFLNEFEKKTKQAEHETNCT